MTVAVRAGEHALVLGASMSGLLAARVLADAYDRVTVVERDVLPVGAEHRRGVPQDRHPHLLLPGGARVMDDLLPGLLDDLAAAGSAVLTEDYSKFHFDLNGRVVAKTGPPKQPLTFHLQTRPFLEARVRQRVRELPNVTMRDGHVVLDLAATNGGRVTGAQVAPRAGGDGEVIAADLVVDATGRAGRTPAFLTRHGFDKPSEDRIAARVTYQAQLLHWPIDTIPEVLFGVDATVERPIAINIIPQENDTAMFWLYGMVGREPPTTLDAMIEWVADLCPPHVMAALRNATPIGPTSQHRIPVAVWRRFDHMKTFPEGLVVIGDAICVFNPTYGQGMTVAALQARSLQACLTHGDTDLARRFFRASAKPISLAWSFAAAGDLAYPEAEGKRTVQFRIGNRLNNLVIAAATTDVEVYAKVMKVSSFVEPPSAFLAPTYLARLLRGNLRARKIAANQRSRKAWA
ncbi:hydroxylase [Knoellia sinensis KCTC 19936]|uniref:Hydroxylase n=1 Tax=Knoellia sinensis KCTC 19936 TaxID=1385520 RepID=A0A0A0J4L5_9MICO|nr:FAD-binding protein [Knoellia sinensis]KGN32148.1 hydroxylase [Knoellia sinensis KCTC 19936]